MVERAAARMVIIHSVNYRWKLEHFDIKSSFLQEKIRFAQPVYLKEMTRADVTYKHGKTVGRLIQNIYGTPSRSYYYLDGMFTYLIGHGVETSEQEACILKLTTPFGTMLIALAVDEFLVAAETDEAMDHFHSWLTAKYNVERLRRPRTYLGWHFNYHPDGSIALLQKLLIDKTLADTGLTNANGKSTPYPHGHLYHPPNMDDTPFPDVENKFMQLVGDLRYLANLTRPDLSFVVGRLGAAMANPTTRHWSIMESTLRYLARTYDYGLHFTTHTETKKGTAVQATFNARPIEASTDADWANDKQIDVQYQADSSHTTECP